MECTDQKIIELTKQPGKRAENQLVTCLLKCKTQTVSVLIKMGLKEADERLSFLYHAIVIFIIQVRKGKFILSGKAKICTYLTQIAKLKWLAFSKGKPLFQAFEDDMLKLEEEEEEQETSFETLYEAMETLSASDKNIVIAFYFYETPLEEYAENNKISYDSAKQRLSRARKRLKENYKIVQQ